MKNIELTINNRQYRLPSQPVVVICIDGNAPEYFEEAIKQGRMPYMASLYQKQLNHISHCVIPSFTNPNNMSIITGTPPAEHGICGNFYFNGTEDVMMTNPELLRVPTILSEFHHAGAKVIAITAKDKLRAMLSHGLDCSQKQAICFSSELANQTTLAEHGIDNAEAVIGMETPDVYSPELSEFVFKAGVALLKQEAPDLMYLTTTDFIQHTYAPEQEGALSFYAMLDSYFSQLDQLGAKLVITADHGMNAKTDHEGKANIVFIDEILTAHFDTGSFRTILPITDPYVAHHSALGSFAAVYVEESHLIEDIRVYLSQVEGVSEVLTKNEAALRFELAEDRIGDIIIVAEENYVVGKSREHHDLSHLRGTLRSHGGISEQQIPLVTNFNLNNEVLSPLRNFDAYYLAMS
ncbi:phosphonoacetate hydrolase [Photobacterium makurazakiensis]|uniref:phosphonoacetate hydrolase n=1 Tax=Photobacterium makurazakiensis TaxID=2910234 RepID=UPI003D0B9955